MEHVDRWNKHVVRYWMMRRRASPQPLPDLADIIRDLRAPAPVMADAGQARNPEGMEVEDV